MTPVADPAVFAALHANDLPRLRELLSADAKAARARNAGGMSILQVAAYMGRHDVVRVLVDHGAVETVHEAAILGDVTALSRLLDAMPAALDAPGVDGFPPLHLAAHFAQHDALELLLERGAAIKARSTNANKNTALHAAAAGAAVATLRILLASGADPDARDAGGNTALHIAAATGAIPCLQALLEGGAAPGRKNNDEQRAVDIAKERGRDEAVEILTRAARR